jgi:seryl-tRNA synthetase
MLDRALLRSDPDLVRRRLLRRGPAQADGLDQVLQLEARHRTLLAELEQQRSQRKRQSKAIGQAADREQAIAGQQEAMRRLGQTIARLEAEVREVEAELRDQELLLPNLPHDSVPDGADGSANVVVRSWGQPPEFAFAPKPHWELGEQLGILDFERASKIAGARFAVYLDGGARLERALINFMLELHAAEHGYREVWPPFLVNSETLTGTGQLPKFAADLFHLEATDFYLVPTAEVPLTNLFRDELLDAAKLPYKFCAYTPCFRSEAGSYGKDVRGLIRQHQFNKVELVRFADPARSYDDLEQLTADAERVLQRLGLHYRVVALCAGDLGATSAKTYDLEVWLPGAGDYREISSCSNCEDYQARRARIRCKRGGGKPELVHTLNGSGLAVGRTLVALLENYQQADGTVVVPEALRPYLGGQELLTPGGGALGR